MDFQLSEDQKALREGLRSFCEGQLPNEKLPDLEKTGGFDRDLWNELADNTGEITVRIRRVEEPAAP